MPTRRKLLKLSAALPVAAARTVSSKAESDQTVSCCPGQVSLDGDWLFRFDPDDAGESRGWARPDSATTEWRTVTVPHTWQIEPANTEYRGVAWYRRNFEVSPNWRDCAVRLEFEAVFHTATVWLNGVEVGRHFGKGYTAFVLDPDSRLRYGSANALVVRVDNAFSESMLPRGRSSDWAHDGGIYRPVNLLVTPRTFVENVHVDAEPIPATDHADIEVSATVRNSAPQVFEGQASFRVLAETTGLTAFASRGTPLRLAAGEQRTIRFPVERLQNVELWHFDHPNLYRLTVELSSGHSAETTFGIRRVEARPEGFFLNGERVHLMGVERMAGSSPEFGMAEPADWIAHDHADMKELNCVYTRVHWPQDRRVLDWCDRHGILIQTEVPTWGAATFNGMDGQPSPEIMNNGLQQLREMIARDRNHPCIFSWGVCNEIGGQNPPAYAFAKRMYEEAKRLDPRRLVTYASNSLHQTPEKDVAGLMDYIMWNEYYETWNGGTADDMAHHLDDIHRAFPAKPIVISEYGYCACTADRPEGDSRRVEVLRRHDSVFRERDWVAGLIFFDYNDYRTHIGDRGVGALRQRVHGVVDVFGAKKPSWGVLRQEASPIASVSISGTSQELGVAIAARRSVPCYRLRAYQVRGIAYGQGQIPVEQVVQPLADLDVGQTARVELCFSQDAILRIDVDVLRPTGFPVWTETWRP